MDPTNPASSEVPLSTPEKKDGHWITIAAMALFVAAALVAVGFLYYQNQQLKSMLAGYQTQPTPTPVDTTDPTASWKTYTNKALGIEFKYPDHYQVLEDSSSRVTFGFKLPADSQPSPYLTISNSNSVDLQKVMKTTNCDALAIGQYCLDGGKGWGQESDVLNTTVGGSSSKSFYISGGVDNAYHIVQLTEKQLELKMNVAGGGLDNTFSQILSTFKFGLASTSSPSATQKACTLEAKLCPDGSSVGRTGPNCEFTECP